jgi:hypothetical protein
VILTDLAGLADRYERVPAQLRDLVEQYPGARAIRNDVGNLAILTAGGTYLGWIDVLTGDVHITRDDLAIRADPLCVWPNGVCTCGEPEGHTREQA